MYIVLYKGCIMTNKYCHYTSLVCKHKYFYYTRKCIFHYTRRCIMTINISTIMKMYIVLYETMYNDNIYLSLYKKVYNDK